MENTKASKKPFLWGVTNIATQTEGGSVPHHWNACAAEGVVPHIGHANDYWHAYTTCHEYVEELGCNAMRISLEWARIEPEEGVFDAAAMMHYYSILRDLKERNITTIVGLFHWSMPQWFYEKYNLTHQNAPEIFVRFAEHVERELGDLIDYLVVLNEPMVYIGTSHLIAERPPFEKNVWRAFKILANFIRMHKRVYMMWKTRRPEAQIGSAHLWNHQFSTSKRSVHRCLEKIAIWFAECFRVRYIAWRLDRYSDYFGMNYYTADGVRCGKKDGSIFGFHGTNNWPDPDVWRIFPQGIFDVLQKAQKYKKPILILENGKPSDEGTDDKDRQVFLCETIKYVKRAIAEGVPIKGYMHYTLMDSYEWNSGYTFRFGLIDVARPHLVYRKRESFVTYQKIIHDGIQ